MEKIKLGEYNSIEIWKEIAYYVQRLSFITDNEYEFHENVQKLRKLLRNDSLEFQIGSPAPVHAGEVGLSTLIGDIENIKVENNYKKAKFYEQIYKLSDLGIKKIAYRPLDEKLVRDGMRFYYHPTEVKKIYTDGTFDFKIKKSNLFNIENIHLYNYIIDCDLNLDEQINNSTVLLNSFNGEYPSLKSMYVKLGNTPTIKTYFTDECDEHEDSKLEFETFIEEEASYQKRLTRTPNNEFYYKEFRK